MSRPKRQEPIEQGVLKRIYELFVLPLIAYKPGDIHLKEWMEQDYFHLDHRTLKHYRARGTFKMPGLFYTAPLLKIQGLGFRDVVKDQLLLVRHDDRDAHYDVEWFGGPGEKEQVFCLTDIEWYRLAPLLEEIPDRRFRARKSWNIPVT